MSAAAPTLRFKDAVNAAMCALARDERTLFIGQSVKYDGAAIFDSLAGIPPNRRLEMPVIEDFQLGFCTGLALTGKIPICIYPRIDFMLLCVNQLVNHLDKMPHWGWHPKVIIRTTVGALTPLNAGHQHTQNHVRAFKCMLESVEVREVQLPWQVECAYQEALASPLSTLIVENDRG